MEMAESWVTLIIRRRRSDIWHLVKTVELKRKTSNSLKTVSLEIPAKP